MVVIPENWEAVGVYVAYCICCFRFGFPILTPVVQKFFEFPTEQPEQPDAGIIGGSTGEGVEGARGTFGGSLGSGAPLVPYRINDQPRINE